MWVYTPYQVQMYILCVYSNGRSHTGLLQYCRRRRPIVVKRFVIFYLYIKHVYGFYYRMLFKTFVNICFSVFVIFSNFISPTKKQKENNITIL